MPQSPQELSETLLHAARKAGAPACDVLVVAGRSVSVDVRGGRLEQVERAESVDLGLRVLIGGRQACVASSDTSADTLAEMAARAVAMAQEAPEDPHAGLADPARLAHTIDPSGLELEDPAADPSAADLQNAAQEAEAAALAVAGVTQVQIANAHVERAGIWLAASNGFSGGYTRSGHGITCSAIAGTGAAMQRDYAGEGRVFHADLPSATDIGTRAGERAAAMLGARKPPAGSYPVLYDQRVAGSLIAHLLSAINGAALARGSSWLRDGLGQTILPAGISLWAEPHRPRIAGSRPFDAEGLPTTRHALVRDGVLESYVLDLASARKLGMQSTAQARRGTSGPPAAGAGNVTLSQGTASQADLLAQMGTGLWVTSMIGSTINPTTGDYSRGASGFWVEGGQVAYPVQECTIAGNLRDMLPWLIPGNDALAHQSRQVPSLLVEGLTLA